MSRIPQDLEADEELDQDNLSARESIERRAVHPYRDRRDALIARRRALARELDAALRAASRKDELERELADVDDELRDAPRPEAPAIETPPPARARREVPRLLLRAASVVLAGILFGVSAAGAATVASIPLGARRPVRPIELAPAPPVHAPAPPIDLDALRSTPEPEPSGPITRSDLDRHVRWIAPQAWEIDRSLAERALQPGSIVQPVRLVPHERDGNIGVRVYGVRRDSLLGRLGIQNGDRILDVNGYAIGSPDRALEAYVGLRDADAFFVRLERRGEERVHVYRIRP